MSDHTNEIFNKVILKFGEESRLDLLAEECAELILAINKYKRYGSLNLLEEIADVEIVIAQLKLIFQGNFCELIEEHKRTKVRRLKALLNEK